MPDTCSNCGVTEPGIDAFASAFRNLAESYGATDPGNVCGVCAAQLQFAYIDAGYSLAAEQFAEAMCQKHWRQHA